MLFFALPLDGAAELVLHMSPRRKNARLERCGADPGLARQLALRPSLSGVPDEDVDDRRMQSTQCLRREFLRDVSSLLIRSTVLDVQCCDLFAFGFRQIRFKRQTLTAPSANPHQGFVDRDANQPGRKTRTPLKPMDVRTHFTENVLKIVLCVCVILQNLKRYVVDLRQMHSHEFAECFPTAAARSLEQYLLRLRVLLASFHGFSFWLTPEKPDWMM